MVEESGIAPDANMRSHRSTVLNCIVHINVQRSKNSNSTPNDFPHSFCLSFWSRSSQLFETLLKILLGILWRLPHAFIACKRSRQSQGLNGPSASFSLLYLNPFCTTTHMAKTAHQLRTFVVVASSIMAKPNGNMFIDFALVMVSSCVDRLFLVTDLLHSNNTPRHQHWEYQTTFSVSQQKNLCFAMSSVVESFPQVCT